MRIPGVAQQKVIGETHECNAGCDARRDVRACEEPARRRSRRQQGQGKGEANQQIGEDGEITKKAHKPTNDSLATLNVGVEGDEQLQQHAEPSEGSQRHDQCFVLLIRAFHRWLASCSSSYGMWSKKSTTPVSSEYSAPTTN